MTTAVDLSERVRVHPRLPVASVQGALALDLRQQLDPPPVSVLAEGAHPTRTHGATVTDLPRPAALDQWARRYLQAVIDIVAGDRPAAQLVRWTSPAVMNDLTRRAQLIARAGGHTPGLGRIRGSSAVRPQLRSLRTCVVHPDAAEVSAHVRYGERSRALAARFERRRARWVCVALEFA